jgi:hypothetical protein
LLRASLLQEQGLQEARAETDQKMSLFGKNRSAKNNQSACSLLKEKFQNENTEFFNGLLKGNCWRRAETIICSCTYNHFRLVQSDDGLC